MFDRKKTCQVVSGFPANLHCRYRFYLAAGDGEDVGDGIDQQSVGNGADLDHDHDVGLGRICHATAKTGAQIQNRNDRTAKVVFAQPPAFGDGPIRGMIA